MLPYENLKYIVQQFWKRSKVGKTQKGRKRYLERDAKVMWKYKHVKAKVKEVVILVMKCLEQIAEDGSNLLTDLSSQQHLKRDEK